MTSVCICTCTLHMIVSTCEHILPSGGTSCKVSSPVLLLIIVWALKFCWTTQCTVMPVASSWVVSISKVLLTKLVSEMLLTQKAGSVQSWYLPLLPSISQWRVMCVPLTWQVKFALLPIIARWLWTFSVNMMGSVERESCLVDEYSFGYFKPCTLCRLWTHQ